MYGADVVNEGLRLADLGLSNSEISRRTGAARSTIRSVYRLRVTLDNRYPRIIEECAERMSEVMPGRSVLVQPRRQSNCSDVGCYSKQWPCLFPQHSTGAKHKRAIILEPWQQALAGRYPEQMLRGFIHSDGTRHLNRVNGRDYPRYMFSNRSSDLMDLFCEACDLLGVRWTRSYRWTISVARADAVARLDSFIGPKR